MFFGFLKRKLKYPASDRRREPRHEATDEFLLEFSTQSGGGKTKDSHYIGASRDISLHGIRFVTTCKLKQKDKILLNLRFPKEFPGIKHVTVRAKVARVYKPRGTDRYRVGCSLQHDSETGKEAIRQFIYWMENKPEK